MVIVLLVAMAKPISVKCSFTCDILYIMHIHGHCTLMYPGLLYVFTLICRVVSLYYADWVAGLPLGSSSLHFCDGLTMYFGHRMTPLTSHIRGHLLQLILPPQVNHTCMAFPYPSTNSLDLLDHFFPLMFPRPSLQICENPYTRILNP